MANPAASTSGRSGFPDWVLLDTVAHKGRSRSGNASTAVTLTSAGSPVEVSFAFADAPALTRCIIHCPELSFVDEPPLITGADGAFLLISAIFPKSPGRTHPHRPLRLQLRRDSAAVSRSHPTPVR
ncbi:unnamed protein product [Urochloa humidicola]